MRIASLFLVAGLATTVSVACNGRRSGADTDGLDAQSAALIEDDSEASDTDEDLELGLEEPLSGAAEGGEVDVAGDPAAVAEKARTNPGVFFQPAGCIVSTRDGNVVTHVFSDCTGPYGLVHFTGTVISTWSKSATGVQVQHVAKGFRINGATVDHTVTVAYAKTDGVYTKTRKAASTGTTAGGRAITHSADWVTTWDPATRCIARDGSGQTTIGSRAHTSSIVGYERCGIGIGGCPKSGTVTLTGPRGTLTLQFPGGASVDIGVNGKTYHRPLVCRAL